jgi:hypothetical protein
LFQDLRTENRAGNSIAKIYKEIKIYKAALFKTDIQSAFKGLHMPSIICCILYCTLLEENRGMPISIIVFNMNQALLKSRTSTTPINLQTVTNYRTNKKYAIGTFFKYHKKKCYNTALLPSDFMEFTCNTILRIQKKNIKKMLNELGNEIFKEYPDSKSPATIATGILFYIGNKLGTIDYKNFGLKKKELNDMKIKLENSKNKKIIEILSIL